MNRKFRSIWQWLPVVAVLTFSSCKKENEIKPNVPTAETPAKAGNSGSSTEDDTDQPDEVFQIGASSASGENFRESSTSSPKEQLTTVGSTPIYKIQGKNAFFFNSGMSLIAAGAPKAYHANDAVALDFLKNAGAQGNWWSLATNNGRPDGTPIVQTASDPAPGYYVSTTSLTYKDFPVSNPKRYVSATATPFIALPPSLAGKAKIGDFAAVINKKTGALTYAIFAEVTGEGKVGAASINAAHRTRSIANPKNGGTQSNDLIYIVFPNSGNGFGRSSWEIKQNGKKLLDEFGGGVMLLQMFGLVATPAVPAPTPQPAPTPLPTPITAGGHKVIGYFPTWSGDVNRIQYDKLTHVIYSFILPTATGGISPIDDPQRFKNLVALAHSKGVKVLMAVGGWNNGDDSAFEALARNESTRNTFIQNLVNFCNTYNLDGIDMDWEYPDAGASAANYAALMKGLSNALHSKGKLLTAAVVSRGYAGDGILSEVFNYVDFLNLMAYDHGTPHSTQDEAKSSIAYWRSRGCSKEKVMLGVPFYGREPYVNYNDLVKRDPGAPNKDVVGGIHYNGIQTIKNKTTLSMQEAGGIMIWEISQDTEGQTSLLNAINDVVKGIKPAI